MSLEVCLMALTLGRQLMGWDLLVQSVRDGRHRTLAAGGHCKIERRAH